MDQKRHFRGKFHLQTKVLCNFTSKGLTVQEEEKFSRIFSKIFDKYRDVILEYEQNN